MAETKYITENARITEVYVGSATHDFRALFTISFDYGGAGQSSPSIRLDQPTVDGVIRACDAKHLFDCKGKYVRVLLHGTGSPMIVGINHIVDECPVIFTPV
jgi:hypothetical protein